VFYSYERSFKNPKLYDRHKYINVVKINNIPNIPSPGCRQAAVEAQEHDPQARPAQVLLQGHPLLCPGRARKRSVVYVLLY